MEFVVMKEEEFANVCDSFLGSNYCQTVKWGKVKEFTGWQRHYLGIWKNNGYLGIALLLSKKVIGGYQMFYAPRGALMDYENRELLKFFTDNVKKYLRENKGIFLKMDPEVTYTVRDKWGKKISEEKLVVVNNLRKSGYRHKGFTTSYTKDMQYRWTYLLDVNASWAEIEKEMDKRCRRCLRKEKKYPLIMEDVDENNIYDFKGVMEHTAKRQKHFDRSIEYYLKLKKEFQDDIYMKIIYLDREKYLLNFQDDKLYDLIKKEKRKMVPLSAGVFIRDKRALHYVYGGTYDYYMGFMAQYKMQIDMIMTAKILRTHIYDFGGISGNFEAGSLGYGTYEFKRGFGGYIVEYIGEFDLVIRGGLYFLFNFMYGMYKWVKKMAVYISHS